MSSKPNFVFLISDSLDGRKLGYMGAEPLADATPNLDRLATSGMTFEQTYCTNPVCVCSRASMLAGQYTFNCHAWNNYKGIPANSETMFKALEREGYQLGLFGKTDYVSGRHTQRARVSAWLRSAKIMKPQYNMGAPIVIEEEERCVNKIDWKTIDAALEFLKEHRDQDEPFFLYASLNSPHPRLKTSRYYLNRIRQEAIQIPPKEENEHPVMAYMRMCKNWTHTPDDESVRRARAVYYAMIAEVDEMFGEILKACEGVENTYFFFLSDHGEMNMEHGQYYKYTAYEPSARVPLVVAGPGVLPGARIEHIESLIDIFPTILELAGGTTSRKLDGSSLVPVLRSGRDNRENIAFCEYHDSGACTGIVMLRRDQYKYVAYPGYEPQLFDLAKDPWEIHNLASERPELVQEMDERLRQITNYEAHDHMVKEYDHDSFRVWREGHKAAGDYEKLMARTFCGADDEEPDIIPPWTEEDEKAIIKWLEDDF